MFKRYDSDQQNPERHPRPQISETERKEQPIATNSNTGNAHKPRTFRQKWRLVSINNKLIVGLTGVIAMATVIYTIAAGFTLREILSGSTDTHDLAVAAKNQSASIQNQLLEMQKQTAIYRQQLVGSQAAVIEAVVEFPDVHTVSVQIRNTGHVIASDIEVTFQVTMASVPDLGAIGTSTPHRFTRPKLAPFTDRWEGERYPVNAPPDYIESIRHSTRTLTAKGTVTYDDGFPERPGDRQTIPFCRAYVGFTGKTTTYPPQAVKCDDVASTLRGLKENEEQRNARPN